MPTILIKKDWTPQSVLAAHEAGGKKYGVMAGSWIDDIAAQKKVITLCSACKPKFDPRKVGYKQETEFKTVNAPCDGCSSSMQDCTLYIYGELYSTVRSTAEERRALAKARQERVRLTGHL